LGIVVPGMNPEHATSNSFDPRMVPEWQQGMSTFGFGKKRQSQNGCPEAPFFTRIDPGKRDTKMHSGKFPEIATHFLCDTGFIPG